MTDTPDTLRACDCHSCELGTSQDCYGCPVHGAWCDWLGEGPKCAYRVLVESLNEQMGT